MTIVTINPEYHRRQAATLTQLAQTTRDPDTAKALLRVAADHVGRADDIDASAIDASDNTLKWPPRALG